MTKGEASWGNPGNGASVCAAAVAVLFAVGPVAAQEDRTGWLDSFTVGTGTRGGTFFEYGAGWAGIVSEVLGIPGTAEVTTGPMQNMALVHTGALPFSMTTMGPAAESYAGTNPIAPGLRMTGACAMFPMYQTPFSITALAGSGIDSIADIPMGARIGFGPAGSTSNTYFPQMLRALGVDFERRNGGWDELAGELREGGLDLIAFSAGVPIPAVAELEAATDITIIGFTEDELATLTNAFPVSRFDIPAETYATLGVPAPAVAMWNFAIARCDLPESFVHAVVDAVMSENARLISAHPAARETLPEHWDKNTALLWHPGAARWFIENAGATIPDTRIHGM